VSPWLELYTSGAIREERKNELQSILLCLSALLSISRHSS
jgi:hypothetical protein